MDVLGGRCTRAHCPEARRRGHGSWPALLGLQDPPLGSCFAPLQWPSLMSRQPVKSWLKQSYCRGGGCRAPAPQHSRAEVKTQVCLFSRCSPQQFMGKVNSIRANAATHLHPQSVQSWQGLPSLGLSHSFAFLKQNEAPGPLPRQACLSPEPQW